MTDDDPHALTMLLYDGELDRDGELAARAHLAACEQCQRVGFEVVRVADPDVEVAAIGVTERTRAAHQVDRVDARLCCGTPLWREAAREAGGTCERGCRR